MGIKWYLQRFLACHEEYDLNFFLFYVSVQQARLKFFNDLFSIYVYMYLYDTYVRVPEEARRETSMPWSWVSGSYESPDVGVTTQTLVLCKSMELSLLLSQLSSSWLNWKPLAFATLNTCGSSQSEAPRILPITDHRTQYGLQSCWSCHQLSPESPLCQALPLTNLTISRLNLGFLLFLLLYQSDFQNVS